MAVKWLVAVSLPIVFLIGAASPTYPRLAIAAMSLGLLAVIVRIRFRPKLLSPTEPTRGLQPDWLVVLLPIILATRLFSDKGSLLIIGLLVAIAFIRKPDSRFRIQAGPLYLLFASSAIVFSRPADPNALLTFLLVGTLTIRLIMTVDARKIIASLVDGCGLYLVANVLAYAIGLQSPLAYLRIGGLVESTGFIRIIYPLTSTLNAPPTIAAMYAVAFVFLIQEPGWLRRSLRLIFLIAAIVVLVGAGSRVPMVAAALLSVTVICFPFIARWIGQVTTMLAAVSAFVLPSVIASIEFAVAPLISFAPGRVTDAGSIATLQGRDYVWDRSIKYWNEWINDIPHILAGFGVNGPYRSGASLSYSERLSTTVRNPELASTHNSFLQQLFDGGLLGWLLLGLALYWACVRLSKRRHAWGNYGLSAIVAMTALLLSAMTEVSLTPGSAQDTLWLLIVLVGISCQAKAAQPAHNDPARGAHDATAEQVTPGPLESRHSAQSMPENAFHS